EINRVLTDHASDLLLTPTDAATRNLEREGICGGSVHQSGDVMYDAAVHYGSKAERDSTILRTLGVTPAAYVLATIHRPQNTDDVAILRNILAAFAASPHPVVWPIHPRTRRRLQQFALDVPPT